MKKKSSSKGSMIKFKTHTGAKYEFVSWKYWMRHPLVRRYSRYRLERDHQHFNYR